MIYGEVGTAVKGVGMVVPGVITWLRWSAGGSGDGGAWCDNVGEVECRREWGWWCLV